MNCPNCHQEIRPNAKFCPHCGHKIEAAPPPAPAKPAPPETQLVRPRPDPAPPPVQPPQPVYRPPVYTPPAANPPAPAPLPAQRRRLPGWPVLAGLAAVLLLALGAVWFFFLRGGGGTAAGAPAGDRALYTLTETAFNGITGESVGVLSRDGDQSELAFDRDGVWVNFGLGDSYTDVAPNGRLVAINRSDGDGTVEMSLVAADGGAEVFTAGRTLWANARNFAADSSAYAYTRLDDNDDDETYTLVAVDGDGEVIGQWADLVFAGFFSDGNRLLAMRLDDEGLVNDLVTVTLPDGQPQRVAGLDESTGSVAPFVYNDAVYYWLDDELRRVDANGENGETVYRAESDTPMAYVVPGLDRLLILEHPESSSLGDLYAVEPDGSDRVRLDEAVSADPGDGGSIGMAFAAARGRLAYATADNDGLSLHVINADGSERRRLIADQQWLVFAFSPDGRQLAYIAGETAGTGGQLYTVELPDGDPARLARDAWSFLFSGDRLLYTALDGAEGGDPESTVHSITLDGNEDELLFGPEDGFVRFVSPVR